MTVVGVAFASAATILTLGCTALPDDDRPGGTESPDAATTQTEDGGRWTSLAPSPLAARHDAVGVWTGSEMVVAGGTTARPCPLGADCVEQSDKSRADGAAYDPATGSWRTIADAPMAFVAGEAVWSGTEMVVVAPSATLAYDPVTDDWRRLQRAPRTIDEPAPPVVTDDGIVLVSYDQVSRRFPTDLVLDPATGAWSALPRDPFGESYDRSMAWDGERLWLMSMAVQQHFSAYDGAVSRLAMLEGGLSDGTWRVVDPKTPAVVQGQVAWWTGDRLLLPAPSSLGDAARSFDTRAQTWTQIDGQARSRCALPRVGPGPEWVADGPTLTSLDGSRTLAVPGCDGLPDPDVAVWAEDRLILWGGPDRRYQGNSTDGLQWSPPD